MTQTINGLARFEFYLIKLETLLLEAAKQPDPALWLYQNGARTPLFMLEGLSKLYGGLHNKKRFEKMEKQFKLLEDGLGSIDYYDAFAEEFATDLSVPVEQAQTVRSKCNDKIASLNELLKEKKWLGEKPMRLAKIKKKLHDAQWLEEEKEINAIESFYRRSIDKITEFAKKYKNGFTELESQVHELRRRLRWLSIYPQALQGCIQLIDTSSQDANMAKYLTPDVVNSPFNKVAAVGANKYLLMLSRDHFFALSWMIAELGKLKDSGLRIEVLREAGSKSKTGSLDETPILEKASDICETFFNEKTLDNLVIGVSESA